MAAMEKRLHGKVKIESLRNHSAEVVRQLQQLLASGADARKDPHHKDFYEIEDAGRVFYTYVSPVSGEVRLMAVWRASSAPEVVRAARACCAA
jgi:hypothetical protein